MSFADVPAAKLAFLASPGVLLDALALPPYNGSAIAAAISNGTAASVVMIYLMGPLILLMLTLFQNLTLILIKKY